MNSNSLALRANQFASSALLPKTASQRNSSHTYLSVGVWLAGFYFLLFAMDVTVAQDAGQEGINNAIEEVIVTARRREENVQTVPLAVTVLSEEVLIKNGVTSLLEVQSLVPSMVVGTSNVGQRDVVTVSIRGQGWSSLGGEPGVSMYLNEVPIATDIDGNLFGGPGLFFDLQSVQILKGPQGTLFGRNSVGGAVLLQSARPTGDFSGYISGAVGNYSNRELSGAINIPLFKDVLSGRVAFATQERDGFSHVQSMPNYPNGIDLDNRDTWSIRGTLTYQPTDTFKNDLIYTHQEYKSNGSANFLVDVVEGGLADTTYPGLLDVFQRQRELGARHHVPLSNDLSATGGYLKALNNITEFQLTPDLTVKNIFGYQRGRVTQHADVDGTRFPIFDVRPYDYLVETVSNEIQLLGESFDGNFSWVVGAFWSDAGPPDRYSVPLFGTMVVEPVGTTEDPDPGRRMRFSERKAIFAQGSYSVTDAIEISAGVRYTESFKVGGSAGNEDDYTIDYGVGHEDSEPSFLLGLDYHLNDATMAYVVARRAFRPSGETRVTDLDNPDIVLDVFPYGPEHLNDLEIGLKADWQLGSMSLRTNVALFYQDYENIQVNRRVPYPGRPNMINKVENAGAARLTGAEFEGWLTLTDDVSVSLHFSHLDFDYLSFNEGVDVEAYENTDMANRIPWTAGTSVDYRLGSPSIGGDVSLYVNWSWQDEMGDFLGTTTIDPRWTVNATLGWERIANSAFDLQLYSTNLTDEIYHNGGIALLGFAQRTYGEPRMYGVRLRYSFEAN